MPYYVKALIEGHPKPVYVLPTDSVQMALGRMIEHDYSQLAVIDSEEERRPQGIITSDSIVRALNSFGVTTDKLRVYDAMVRTQRSYYADDDIFDFLNELLDVGV